jgi:uncharacterized protein DUF742
MGNPADTGPDGEPVVRTGARFPSAKQLAKLDVDDVESVPVIPDGESHAPAQLAGARFPSERQRDRYVDPGEEEPEWPPEPALEGELDLSEEPEPVVVPRPAKRPLPRQPGSEEPDEVSGPRVRPYVLTRGRTQSTYELRLETMVSLRSDAKWEGVALNAEYQPVRALCASARSVAEVAANLSVPIGVARVLLSDMADLGLMHIHGTERTAEGRPPVGLMRRVLDGLQRL